MSDSESSGQRGLAQRSRRSGTRPRWEDSPRSPIAEVTAHLLVARRRLWTRVARQLKGRDSGPRLAAGCETILDSLAYHYPGIAAEWSPNNPISAWHVRPSGQTTFLPAWVCFVNPASRSASLASRSSGAGCPDCREHGKSKVELDHFAAAEQAFESARSGQSVRHEAFRRRPAWLVDVTAELPGGQKLAIEYDGSYWHARQG